MPVRPILKDNALLGCRSEESGNRRASKESGENEKDQEVTDREPIKEDEESAGDVGIVSGEGKGLSQSESGEGGRSDLPGDPGICAPCGGVGQEEEGEDGREPVRVRTPDRVSKVERERHELTHTPFRQWCEF